LSLKLVISQIFSCNALQIYKLNTSLISINTNTWPKLKYPCINVPFIKYQKNWQSETELLLLEVLPCIYNEPQKITKIILPKKAEKFLKYQQHTLNIACLFPHNICIFQILYK